MNKVLGRRAVTLVMGAMLSATPALAGGVGVEQQPTTQDRPADVGGYVNCMDKRSFRNWYYGGMSLGQAFAEAHSFCGPRYL